MTPTITINVMQCRSTYTTGGGPDKTALLVAERADRDKFNVVLMYMRGASDQEFQLARWARERGLSVHEVLERRKFSITNLKEINALVRQHKIHILHARDYKTTFLGFLLAKINPGIKLVFTAHGWVSDCWKTKVYMWLNMICLRSFHRIIAVSNATKQIMVDHGINEEEIEVVYNAIDTDQWRRDKVVSSFRDEMEIPEEAKVIGVVGRLSKEKAIGTTLAVAREVIKKRPDTWFVLVGDGPCRREVENEIELLGLTEKVILAGFRKDALNIYAALDVFLSTSLTEGIPNTVLEAMAMEVPVVHTAVGGVPEMIEDGIDGILCKVGDVVGMAEAVLGIVNDEARAVQLRERGRLTVCSRFSFNARMKAIEAIYEQVAAS